MAIYLASFLHTHMENGFHFGWKTNKRSRQSEIEREGEAAAFSCDINYLMNKINTEKWIFCKYNPVTKSMSTTNSTVYIDMQ